MSKLKVTENSEPFKQVSSDNYKSQNEPESVTNREFGREHDEHLEEDPQLQKMMEQFVEEVVVENSADN